MHMMRTLDHTGDSQFEFSPNDQAAVAAAEALFKEKTGKGFLAFAANPGTGGGDSHMLRAFDKTVPETIFTPARAGG